ncbi:MAG: hypothetical protein MUF18_01785 [Fimbriiglobus sp.]|nr:hypothetical protein [Fimbriiglobus sp.]
MADEDTPVESYPFEFRALVVRELEHHGLALKEWRDDGLDVEREDGQQQFVGLANLYRRVITSPAELSERLVKEFFANAHIADTTALDQIPDRLEDAADMLRARLGRPYDDADHAPWGMPLDEAGELAVSLVLDFPTMMAFVTRPMANKSDTPMETWVQRGIENLKATAPDGWLQLAHEEEGIWIGHVNDSYDAARALILCDATESDELGWMVAIPARDWLFARKVDQAGLQFFHLLKVGAERAFAEQPYPISDDVYWVRPGNRWVKFPMTIDGNQVTVTPPQEFVEALGLELREEAEGDQNG